MAQGGFVSTREQLDRELDALAGIIPVWREKLRHEAQFWPQFRALSGEIMAHADRADREHVERRIAQMLAANGRGPDESVAAE